MCNTKNEEQDYRFIDYRLQQLEQNLQKGIEKIEQDNQKNNTQILQTLEKLQEGQHKTYETIAQLEQRTTELEKQQQCIDKLKDAASKNTQRNEHTNHRIDVIQKILFAVATAAIGAFMTALFALLTTKPP